MSKTRTIFLGVVTLAIATVSVRCTMKEKRFGMVFAGENQFYIADGDIGSVTGEPTFWTESAFESRIAVGPAVVGVRTSSSVFVPVSIRYSQEERVSFAPYIVEAPLQITTGFVRVLGCPDHDPGIAVPVAPGDYTVRIEFTRITEDGSELWWHGDRYRITIFKRRSTGPVILHDSAKKPNQTVETTRLLAPRIWTSGFRSTGRFHSKKTGDRAPRASHL